MPYGLTTYSYDTERRQAALAAVRRTERYSGGLSTSNPLKRGVRDTLGVLAGKLDKLRVPMTQGLAGFDTRYEEGVVGTGRQVKGWGEVGKRVEQLPPALRSRATFRLISSDSSQRSQLKAFARRWSAEIDVGVMSSGGAGVALVRPDDHLAWVGSVRRLPELRALLDQWLLVS